VKVHAPLQRTTTRGGIRCEPAETTVLPDGIHDPDPHDPGDDAKEPDDEAHHRVLARRSVSHLHEEELDRVGDGENVGIFQHRDSAQVRLAAQEEDDGGQQEEGGDAREGIIINGRVRG
jgi:hypothetical protein